MFCFQCSFFARCLWNLKITLVKIEGWVGPILVFHFISLLFNRHNIKGTEYETSKKECRQNPEHCVDESVCFDVNGLFEDFVVRINAIVSGLFSFTNLQS